MSALSLDDLHLLINALQLSIVSQISRYSLEGANAFSITFVALEPNDTGWKLFQRLVPGIWDSSHKTYQTHDISSLNVPLLTNFLMLSRLQKQNMKKLAELDSQYQNFIKQMGILPESPASRRISSLQEAGFMLSTLMKEKKMTLRQLSEKTGLSTVSLSHFKKGGDIRLSNLLRIIQKLGRSLKLE